MAASRVRRTAAVTASWSVYILRCADGSLYTGISTDVRRRMAEHACGSRGAKYLKGRLPATLLLHHVAGDRSAASRLEYRIKRLSRAEKERLLSNPAILETWIESAADAATCRPG